MKKNEELSKADLIRADICSRPNAMNGKYKLCNIELELEDTRTKDVFFLETLQVRADSADRMIAEAESQGKDTTDPEVMRELGKKINALGKPLHLHESIMTAFLVTLRRMVYFGIAIGIWGLVFKKSFLIFGLYGVAVGLLISLLSAGPVVAFQRTRKRIRNIVDGVSLLLGNSAIIIGAVGLIVLAIRLIFYMH